jgi:hypothetical protein
MGKILTWLAKKIGKELVIDLAIYFVIGLYIASIVTAGVSIYNAFMYFFTHMQDFIDLVSGNSSGVSSSVSKLFGLLNCIGFVDAFNGTKAVWLSGITFLFSAILFKTTHKIFNSLLNMLAVLK